MNNRQIGLLVANGALVVLAGFAAGAPFGAVVANSIDPATGFAGDVRAWRMAHLEGVMNGMLMLAAAAVAARLTLSEGQGKAVLWGLVVAGWTNIIASTISALTGGRGTGVTGFDWNTLNFLLFMAGIVGSVWALIVLVQGGLALAKKG